MCIFRLVQPRLGCLRDKPTISNHFGSSYIACNHDGGPPREVGPARAVTKLLATHVAVCLCSGAICCQGAAFAGSVTATGRPRCSTTRCLANYSLWAFAANDASSRMLRHHLADSCAVAMGNAARGLQRVAWLCGLVSPDIPKGGVAVAGQTLPSCLVLRRG